jgi:hypothetical protein
MKRKRGDAFHHPNRHHFEPVSLTGFFVDGICSSHRTLRSLDPFYTKEAKDAEKGEVV